MSSLHAYLALRAASERRAVQKATRRHYHISNHPLVLVGYHLAGDVGAPLALMWGDDASSQPSIAVVPEPRNRQLRFDALRSFGHALVDYLSNYEETRLENTSYGQTEEVCVDAPQIVVPNPAVAEWLFGIVGRFTRHLRTDGSPAAHPVVPLAGKHLSLFHNLMPGSSLVLPATEILATHWQTGQLPSEDLNLSALLGWIDPGESMDGPEAARIGENLPPAGPLPDPNWDADKLDQLVKDWHGARSDSARSAVRVELEAEIRAQLTHTWLDCWHSLQLLEELPEGGSVANRWRLDRLRWSRHKRAIENETAHFRNIPTPVQAARTLKQLEQRTEELEAQMALDDPLIMAKYVAAGEALSARVVNIDMSRTITGPSGRHLHRPVIILESQVPFMRPAGTELCLATDSRVKLEILDITEDVVRVQVNAGALTANTAHRLPEVGNEVVLSPFSLGGYYPSRLDDDVPWTHQIAEHDEVAL